MTILSELIKSLKTDDKLQQLRELCAQIKEEEKCNRLHEDIYPVGPNVLLSLDVKGRYKKEVGILNLELTFNNTYIIVYQTYMNKKLKVVHTWEANDDRPEKILTKYAEKYKLLRGI